MSKADLHIGWATHKAAKMACERWHYAGCLPTGKLVKIGVWENGEFIGVVCFGRGAAYRLLMKYGLEQTGGCEMVRIALRSHETQVSKIVAIALRLLKESMSGLRLVVSFADPAHGHHGGIYQAGNWVYTGLSAKGGALEYFYRGKWVHAVSFRKAVNKDIGREFAEKHGIPYRRYVRKHRYLMPLDAAMRAQIEPLRQPYPKRPKQATADTIGTAAGQHRPGRSNQQATA